MIKSFKNDKGKQEVFRTYNDLVEQWSVPVEDKAIYGKYGSTHVIIAGKEDNPPLLLFHGVGDNSALMWIFNAKELSKHFRIYAIDTMGGAGKSVSNDNYEKNFDVLNWLSTLLDSLKISKAFAVGVSYGSLIVQQLLCYMPDKVIKGVCLAGGSASAEYSKKSSALKKMKIFLPEALFPTKSNCIKLVKKLGGENSIKLIDNKSFFTHWCLLLKYFNNTSMMKHNVKPIEKEKYLVTKDNCLFVIGDKDKIAYSEDSVKALQQSDLNYLIIEGAGHPVNHEYPEKINMLIVDFLLK